MKYIILLLSLLSTSAFSVDKVIKAPSGKVIFGTQANVRASEGAGTTTLTIADAREQIFNLSAARIVKLPTTGVKAGDKWVFKNNTRNVSAANSILTIQPSGSATTLAIVNSLYATAEATALINTPTAATDWQVNFKYDGPTYNIGNTYNNSTTLSISGASNMHNALIPYQTIDGKWRMKANFEVSTSNTNSFDFSYTNTTCSGWWACSAYCSGSGYNPVTAVCAFENNYISVRGTNASLYWNISCDHEINSRPTWAY